MSYAAAIYVQKLDKGCISAKPVQNLEKFAGNQTVAKPPPIPAKRPLGTWVQTDREAHEAWAILAKKPAASAVMHILCANLGEHNAVVISQDTIAKLCGLSTRSVRRAIVDLAEGRWIEVRQLGVCCRTGLNPTLSPFRPSVFPREQDVGPSEGRDVSQEAG